MRDGANFFNSEIKYTIKNIMIYDLIYLVV